MNVSRLFIYPVKSAAGIAVSEFELGARGPINDRHWMVVNDSGKFMSQRHTPRMCFIEPQLGDNGLSLIAPNMPPILVGNSTVEREVVVWNDTVMATDCGDEVAAWLSDFLDRSCRLVEMPESTKRLVDTRYAKQSELVGFADGFPLLITSEASHEELNRGLDQAVGVDRFRPNIVIDGCTPYAEDSWYEIAIGKVLLTIVKPCSRCIIPSIDPLTAEKNMAVNDALLKFRKGDDGRTYFGQNALYQGLGTLRVGDSVEVKSLA